MRIPFQGTQQLWTEFSSFGAVGPRASIELAVGWRPTVPCHVALCDASVHALDVCELQRRRLRSLITSSQNIPSPSRIQLVRRKLLGQPHSRGGTTQGRKGEGVMGAPRCQPLTGSNTWGFNPGLGVLPSMHVWILCGRSLLWPEQKGNNNIAFLTWLYQLNQLLASDLE